MKPFAVLILLVMAALNILGSHVVARAQTVVVVVVVGILIVFSIATLSNLDLDLLAFSGYPPLRDIVSSVALTFFAFLGFGVITFTASAAKITKPVRCRTPRSVSRVSSARWSGGCRASRSRIAGRDRSSRRPTVYRTSAR